MHSSAAGALRAIVALDGLATLGFLVATVVERHPVMVSLALVATVTWLLALASVPRAAARPTPESTLRARTYVATGFAMNSVGAVIVLVSFPAIVGAASAVLVAGIAVSSAYLALLPRLSTPHKEARTR